MERKKYYLIIIVVLFITNIVTIYSSFKKNGMPRRHEGPRDLIIERLHFNEQQISKYDILIEWHQKNIREKDSLLLSLKSNLYKSLYSEKNTDSIITIISIVQKDIENIHLKHFRDIESICTTDQKKYFEELTVDLAELFGRKPRRRIEN